MDVTVLGLNPGGVLLEDLAMDVPHGVTVTIPADRAYKSTDLWRAIGQRQLFHLRQVPNHVPPTATNNRAVEAELREQIRRLEAENVSLRARLAEQEAEARKQLVAQQGKLDSILTMLQAGIPFTALQVPAGVRSVSSEVADHAPSFIPSNITPDNVESRIDTKKDEAQSTSATTSASKLREMRQKGRQ